MLGGERCQFDNNVALSLLAGDCLMFLIQKLKKINTEKFNLTILLMSNRTYYPVGGGFPLTGEAFRHERATSTLLDR